MTQTTAAQITAPLFVTFGDYRNDDERYGWHAAASDALVATLKMMAPPAAKAASQKSKEDSIRFRQAREESHERCDTDGFLTQWSLGIDANKASIQADIDAQGGYDVFPALFTADGEPTGAELREGQYGPFWFLRHEQGKARFVNAFPKRSATLAKKGYREGLEVAKAEAFVNGEGFGLSGRAWASSRRVKE